MRRPTTPARRYAQALLDVALPRGSADEWASQLRQVATLVENADVSRLLASPAAALDAKKEAIRLAAGALSPEVEVLLGMVLARKRSYLLPALAEAFDDLLREERGIVRAEVVTAIPLAEASRALLGERLSHYLGRGVEIQSRVDPAILGGVIARIGDRLLDDSVRGRLERLRLELETTLGP